MTRYTFQTYPASATARFECPSCGKKNRVRKFTAECTVNPFNINPDGSVRTPSEVRQQSKLSAEQAREGFLRSPLCATCESAISYAHKKAIAAIRRAAA